ncbi:MAG: hypothetical protein CMM50_14390 [Rhodospirillaceae bacterium]|nr:hypothetical protein [Rhodospirillaceae bacterium]
MVIAAAPPVPGSAATASIVAVGGQPLPAARFAVLAGLGGSGQAPLIQQASPQAQPAPLPAGSVIVASLLGRPTVAALNALPGPLAAGTPTALRVLSIAPPALSAIPGTPVQANAAALAGTQSIAAGAGAGAGGVSGGATAPTPGASTPAPGVIPQTAAAPASTAPAGTGAPTPVLGSAPPTGPGAAPVLAALVVGQDGNGQTLVRANGMVLTLADRTPLPLGTTLRLEVLPRPEQAPPPLAGATAVRTDPVLALSHSWPALNEIVEVLRQASPAVANQFLGTAIPAANGQLLANVMTFLFGVQIANPRNWLGPQVVQALERAGRGDLVRRLGDDFGRVSRLAQEPGGGDWRTFLIPFLDGEHLQQIRMYLRDHRGEAEEGREEPGQRMIVDLDLTRLGAMQLDGLFRERGFDLLIRTHTPLSEEARRDIGTIFDNTMRDTGLKGTLGFHVMRTFPVRPLEDVAGKGGQGVVA